MRAHPCEACPMPHPLAFVPQQQSKRRTKRSGKRYCRAGCSKNATLAQSRGQAVATTAPRQLAEAINAAVITIRRGAGSTSEARFLGGSGLRRLSQAGSHQATPSLPARSH